MLRRALPSLPEMLWTSRAFAPRPMVQLLPRPLRTRDSAAVNALPADGVDAEPRQQRMEPMALIRAMTRRLRLASAAAGAGRNLTMAGS